MQAQIGAEAGKPREGEARSLDVAGFKGNKDGVGQIFHFGTEFWKEHLFAGMDHQKAARALKDAGFLMSNGEVGRRLTNKVRVPGGSRNFYSVSARILQSDSDDG